MAAGNSSRVSRQMDCLLSLSFVRIFSFRVSLTSKAVSAVKSPRHHLLFVSRKRERDQPCPLANLFRFSESKWEGAMRSGVAMLWWHAYGRGWTTSGKIAPMAVRMAALCNRLCARLRRDGLPAPWRGGGRTRGGMHGESIKQSAEVLVVHA